MTPSSNHRVVLADQGSGFVIADAIKVEPVEAERYSVRADAVRFVANNAEAAQYVHTDHLGAPQKMTDYDRAVVWDAAFTPFGEEDSILGGGSNDQRFPGQFSDAESGLNYNYFRDYDPALGRYLQSDPIGLAGGLNTYAYVGGNPVNTVDPDGQNPLLVLALGAARAAPAAYRAARAAAPLLWLLLNPPEPIDLPIFHPGGGICPVDLDNLNIDNILGGPIVPPAGGVAPPDVPNNVLSSGDAPACEVDLIPGICSGLKRSEPLRNTCPVSARYSCA